MEYGFVFSKDEYRELYGYFVMVNSIQENFPAPETAEISEGKIIMEPNAEYTYNNDSIEQFLETWGFVKYQNNKLIYKITSEQNIDPQTIDCTQFYSYLDLMECRLRPELIRIEKPSIYQFNQSDTRDFFDF
ncbi:hypothetical protein PCE1_003035 [Barthelona sp. PCE]